MPKKSTKLEQLSEKIHITVEEMKNLGGGEPGSHVSGKICGTGLSVY